MLVSAGTGWWDMDENPDDLAGTMDIKLAVTALGSLMDDARALNEMLLQWMSKSPTARRIDREVGDLRLDQLGAAGPLLSYLRYNPELSPAWLQKNLSLSLSKKELARLYEMDEPKNMGLLARVGKAAAKQVKAAHFAPSFDI